MTSVYQARRRGVPIVVFALAAMIVAAFLLTGQWDPEGHPAIYEWLGLSPARFGATSGASIEQRVLPFFGHVFVHYGWPHLLMNMLAYFQAAPFVASRLGGLRFLALFFIAAIGGALAFFFIMPNPNAIGAGASGAICGLFGAYFLSVRPTPRAALADPAVRNAMLMFLGINVVLFAVLPFGIAWQAHLGGFIGGALAYLALRPQMPRGPWG